MIRSIWTKAVLAALLVAGLSMPAQAGFVAAPITFSPTGIGGTPITFGSISANPGNALSVGGNSAVATFIATATASGNVVSGGPITTYFTGAGTTQTAFTTYYQAAIQGFLSPTSQPINVPGLNSTFFITAVAAVTEVVTSVSINSATNTATATFSILGTGSNYFQLYESTTAPSNLNGTNFNSGTLILSATPTTTNDTNFTTNTNTPSGTPLDAFGSNNYPALGSVTGQGSSPIPANVTYTNPDYFLTAPQSVDLSLLNGGQALNFTQVDPSAAFLVGTTTTAVGATPVTAGAGLGTSSLGTVNGGPFGGTGGPDFQFQTTGTASFSLTTAVPEPTSMLLLVVGGLGATFVSRRRKA